MGIFKRILAATMVILIIFGSIPMDGFNMVSASPITQGETGTLGRGGEINDKGGIKTLPGKNYRAAFRVSVVRDKDTYMDGTKATRDKLISSYGKKYPLIDTYTQSIIFSPFGLQDDFNGQSIGLGLYNSSNNQLVWRTDSYSNGIIERLTGKSTTPVSNGYSLNKAKIAIQAAGYLTADGKGKLLGDLKNGGWNQFMPSISYADSLLIWNHILDYSGGYDTSGRLDKVVSQYVGVNTDLQTLPAGQKHDITAGYIGVLMSLYRVALQRGITETQGTLSKAIEDYVSSSDIINKPVSIIIDTAVPVNAGTAYGKKPLIVPSYDYMEFGATIPAYASMVSSKGSAVGNSVLPTANTKAQLFQGAVESLKVWPLSKTKEGNSVYRLSDGASENSPYPATKQQKSMFYTAMGWGYAVPGFPKERLATNSGSARWATANADAGFINMVTFSGNIKGFTITSFNVTEEEPTVLYRVENSLKHLSESNGIAKPVNPNTVVYSIKAKSSLISIVEAREKSGSNVKLNMTGKVYREIYTQGVLKEAKKEVPSLSANLKRELSGADLIKLLQGESQNIIDATILNESYEMLPKASLTVKYVYYIEDLNIKLDTFDRIYKWEDIVYKISGVAQNYVEHTVKTDTSVEPRPDPDPDPDSPWKQSQMVNPYIYNTTEGLQYAEIKNNKIGNEQYEVMAGVPSTEELYFSAGGTEYMLSVVMQYWVNETGVERTYRSHYSGTSCEYKDNDTFKGNNSGYKESSTMVTPGAGGGSLTYNIKPNAHESTTNLFAQWAGPIANKTADPKIIGFTPGKGGSPCVGAGATAGTIGTMGPLSNNWDMTPYNAAVEAAFAWAADNNGKVYIKIADSDDVTREWKSVTSAPSGVTYGRNAAITAPGAGYTYHAGTPSVTVAPSGCAHNCTIVNDKEAVPPSGTPGKPGYSPGSPAVKHNHNHNHGSFSVAVTSTTQKVSDKSFTIRVEGGTMPSHNLCGPCCTHELPGVEDTWKQGIFYDYVKISQLRMYKIDQASLTGDGLVELTGMEEIFASIKQGDPTYFMNIAQLSMKSPLQPDLRGAGTVSNIASHNNTMFSNSPRTVTFTGQGAQVIPSESSKFGRLRYTLEPKQHDVVVWSEGVRTNKCDGLGATKSGNPKPAGGNGHADNQPWSVGTLYTNTNYSHEYDFHMQKEGLRNKTGYSDKADDRDMGTVEWKKFNERRRTQNIATVISDFIILQTSGGDQSILYFQKDSESVESQKYFPYVQAKEDEIFTNNANSVFNQAVSGKTSLKDNIKINVGGYNGKYNDPTRKHEPVDGNTNGILAVRGKKVATIFDTDPAATITRPQHTDKMLMYQDGIKIKTTAPNKVYSFDDASVFYKQMIGYFSTDLSRKSVSGVPVSTISQVSLGLEALPKQGENLSKWGDKVGLPYPTKYSQDSKDRINSVVVYSPVSTEFATILPLSETKPLMVEGVEISRDQRHDGASIPNLNNEINKLKVCPLDPGLCEFRTLACKYSEDNLLAQFDFEPTYQTEEKQTIGGKVEVVNVTKHNTYKTGSQWVTTNKVTGIEYVLPTGFTVGNSGKVGTGGYLEAFGTRWSIPFSDLGITNDKNNVVSIKMDFLMESKPTWDPMLISFYGYDFYLYNHSGSNIGLFNTGSGTSGPQGVGLLDRNLVNQKMSIELDFGFNNVMDSKVKINGVPVSTRIQASKPVWQTVGGVRRQVIQTVGLDTTTQDTLAKTMPENLTKDVIGNTINIGSWGASTSYGASYYLDNMEIWLKGGTHEHNSTCYTNITIHETSRIHVHDASCYAGEDKYTSCTGVLNSNYQHSVSSPINWYTHSASSPVNWYTLGCGQTAGSGVGLVKTFNNTSTGQYGANSNISSGTLGGAVSMTGGMYLWTVPQTGIYRIETLGSKGGGVYGGRGAKVQGDFTLTAGEQLLILVGQAGTSGPYNYDYTNSGGGGTFVTKGNNYTTSVPLIVAGSGGGGTNTSINYGVTDASTTTTANNGYISSDSYQGGYAGSAGYGATTDLSSGGGSLSSGGGGFYSNSKDGTYSNGGYGALAYGFRQGGAGGHTGTNNHGGSGGFGGGGGSGHANAGGGGYTGGGWGSYANNGVGGGGGSYNIGTNQVNTASVGTGHGIVTITTVGHIHVGSEGATANGCYTTGVHKHYGSEGSTANGCYTLGTHIHSGTAGGSSPSGCYTLPTEHVHTAACGFVAGGGLQCTGELNTESDFNKHVHTSECLTTQVNLPGQTYNYTGDVQVFTAPVQGNYNIKAWGAQGGGTAVQTVGSAAGLGGYTEGTIKLNKDERVYIYVGGEGKLSSALNTGGGWNGGGHGGPGGFGGGGATDLRIQRASGPNDTLSMLSRIMVAGAGGGADNPGGPVGGADDGKGGHGGNLVGRPGLINGLETHIHDSSCYNSRNMLPVSNLNIGGNSNMVVGLNNIPLLNGGIVANEQKGVQFRIYTGHSTGYSEISNLRFNINVNGLENSYTLQEMLSNGIIQNYTEESEYAGYPLNNIQNIKTGGMASGSYYIANFNFLLLKGTIKSVQFNSTAQTPLYYGNYYDGVTITEKNYTCNSTSSLGSGGGQTSGFNLGLGESVTVSKDTGGAGSGYYGGKVTNNNNGGAGGGSSYISGHSGSNSLQFDTSIDGVITNVTHTGNPIHYTGKKFTSTIMQQGINSGNGKVVITPENDLNGYSLDFSYTGSNQTFVVPSDGYYKLEAWGAQGGMYDSGEQGGLGGYSSGTIYLKKSDVINIQVGSKGNNYPENYSTGVPYNGGGKGFGGGGDGGGSTDFRLSSGNWDISAGLISRIMVAGGGGGSDLTGIGGSGGGLIGGNATGGINVSRGLGGTQTTTGANNGGKGGFGFGGGKNTLSSVDGGGAGGGYYGGTSGTGGHDGGGGGSSYVSGYINSNAVNNLGLHTNQPNHYSGKVFTGIQVEQGVNVGNGRARISSANNILDKIVAGDYTNSEMADYLGPEVMAKLWGPEKVLYTWQNWTSANMKGFIPISSTTISASSNNLLMSYSGGSWEFRVPVNISDGQLIKEIRITMDNNTNATGPGLSKNLDYSNYTSSTQPVPVNSTNNIVVFKPKWKGAINSINFDLMSMAPGSGTVLVKKIELIGYGHALDGTGEVVINTIQTPEESTTSITVPKYMQTTTVTRYTNGVAGAPSSSEVEVGAMGTTSSADTVISSRVKLVSNGQVIGNYPSAGAYTLALNAGSYSLEVWGAQGGAGDVNGGKGGYSKGNITLSGSENLTIYVGGTNGYNGGATSNRAEGYGGGGTDIRRNGTALGNRIIVAGGGGGRGYNYGVRGIGGVGGGLTGGVGDQVCGTPGQGGTQTSGGAGGRNSYAGTLGQGGQAGGAGGMAGGGGGYYGGGGGGNDYPGYSDYDDSGGGGGSGYIGGVTGGTMSSGVQSDSGKAVITSLQDVYSGVDVFDRKVITFYQTTKTTTTPRTIVKTENKTSFEPLKITYASTINDYKTPGSYAFTAPKTGTYSLEGWGANGAFTNSAVSGKGGYTYGEINLTKGETIYVYVGERGTGNSNANPTYTFNGGGYSGAVGLPTGDSHDLYGGRGGGATDFRLNNGTWDNLTGLRSRIMVAGGGGGSGCASELLIHGHAGGLVGVDTLNGGVSYYGYVSKGGTQTTGLTGTLNGSPAWATGSGEFGKGSSLVQCAAGGGGGYYGGGGTYTSGGAGGSSFISGMVGSNAINTSGIHTGQPNHYSGKRFNNTIMIAGNELMPHPNGGVQVGHTGNGSARVTYMTTKPDGAEIRQTILDNVSLIPNTLPNGNWNPIFLCKGTPLNVHECTENCKHIVLLNCTEPHHVGEHYDSSSKICWEACGDDHKHAIAPPTIELEPGRFVANASFLQLDEEFTIYFPNRGNFNGNNALGLKNPQVLNGKGYSNNMDTTKWTREKRVRFTFDTLYKDSTGVHMYVAGQWIELEVNKEYYDFYIPVAVHEASNASVEFEVESINNGVEEIPSLKFSGSITTLYKNALAAFKTSLEPRWITALTTGYSDPRSSNWGYRDYFTFKKGRETTLSNSVIATKNVINSEFPGINERAKPITTNDNFSMMSNGKRSSSLEHLHGGTKQFYIDLVGRIGNFAITDTEDFRFSNFFKLPITSPPEWLIEGFIYKVYEDIQNNYLGDAYDIRGNKVNPNTKWLNTYGTQNWMQGTPQSGRDVNSPNIINNVLSDHINNITQLKGEQLRFGYDIYTTMSTYGDYQAGNVLVTPYYYALTTAGPDKGKITPIDVYISKDGVYEPVNLFDNSINGIAQTPVYEYVLNLDWRTESKRRSYLLQEKIDTERVAEYFKQIIYDYSGYDADDSPGSDNLPILGEIQYKVPSGAYNYLGTAQSLVLNPGHRTFMGSEVTNGNPAEMSKWGSNKNPDNLKFDIEYIAAVQRWHFKLGIPSSSVFVEKGALPKEEHIKKVMNKDTVILSTMSVIAQGTMWTLEYTQPWVPTITIDGSNYNVTSIPPVVAVYSSENSSLLDIDIIKTH